ncbi:type II secretion system F family protein, partial [Pseudomonas aeruginosa]|nr:type II secretion system F family protein [Pseudomonas aeruginosa]
VAFSAALAQWPQAFPPLYLAMISTGELTGKLDICCLQLANQQQEQQRLASKVKKALRYPLIVLSLALLVVLGMLYFVLPEFTAIYQTFSTPLPLLTRMVVAAGDMLSRGWPLLLASLLMIAGALGLFGWVVLHGTGLKRARTMAVNSVVVCEMFY